MRLLLIEGIPGSGKTTIAKEIHRKLQLDGTDVSLYLEDAASHPVHPESIVLIRQNSEFQSSCLLQWQRFVDTANLDDLLHIMEGSAFQMTVRFMIQNNQSDISKYFIRFSAVVASLNPGFIYLRPNNARENSRYVSNLRGHEWTDKVSRGETSTPFAVRNGLKGLEGMHQFWEKYAELCDSLFELWKYPKKQIRFDHGNYNHHVDEAMQFVENLSRPQ